MAARGKDGGPPVLPVADGPGFGPAPSFRAFFRVKAEPRTAAGRTIAAGASPFPEGSPLPAGLPPGLSGKLAMSIDEAPEIAPQPTGAGLRAG